MDKKRILILSYSHLRTDPRIQRQIKALKDHFHIETSGYSGNGDTSIPFFPIYTEPPFSLKRKLNRFFQLLTQQFDQFYWDSGKKNLLNQLYPNNYDVVIANDIHTLPLALAIADNNAKVYFDAHEYHPKEFEDNLQWRLQNKRFVEFLCKKYIPRAAAFSTVCESIAKAYKEYIGVMPSVITNATYYRSIPPTEMLNDKINLIHHGAAIPGRQIENMIDIMKFLNRKYSLFLMLTGKGSKYYNKLISYAGKYENIFFVDPVPYNEIVTTINKYDIGLYCLPPTNFNNHFALPNKIFEFIQARLAIVVSPNPEMADLVRKYKLGVVAEDYTTESMAKAINKLSAREIIKFKENSDLAAKVLSAEENMKKINELVLSLIF